MSFWEVLIILLVAVVVIKPERLPEIAYTLGRIIAKVQTFYHSLTNKYRSYM